jgi:hypothetical protein
VIAENDESITRNHSAALLAAIPIGLRHSVQIPHGTHNDLGDYQRYLKIVWDFLADQ